MAHEGVDQSETTEGSSRDPLALTREETRATFEYQVQRLQEIDNKAIEILKANLLLIGILVTAGSILIQTEFEAGAFLNVFTGFGALLLFISTGLAGVTYTSSNLRGGLDTNDIERAVTQHVEESDEAFEKRLLRSYGRWIEYNAQVTAVNDMLASATVLLVITAFAYVIVGVGVGAAGLSPLLTWLAFVAFTLPMAWLVRLLYHMDHLGTPREEEELDTFAGVRISKGATRTEGFVALKRMLAGPKAPREDDADE